MTRRETDADVLAYLRHLIGMMRAEGATWDAIAARVGVSKAQVINVKDHDRGAGQKTVAGFARVFHGGSLDAFQAAVEAHARANPQASVPRRRGEPYPNRALVMASPEYDKASDDVKEVFETLRGAEGGADKSVVGWSLALANLIERERLGILETGGGKPVKSSRK